MKTCPKCKVEKSLDEFPINKTRKDGSTIQVTVRPAKVRRLLNKEALARWERYNVPLAEAIERERHLLEPIASSADLVLDTSAMTIYELRDAIKQRLVGGVSGAMSILFQSFGFKRGVPADADLVFDVRMLPNPHWVKELRLQTGLDSAVQSFLKEQPVTEELLRDISAFLDNWLPRYSQSNRSYMTIGLGCTGGQHRSVYLAHRLFEHYRTLYPQVHLRHRELQ